MSTALEHLPSGYHAVPVWGVDVVVGPTGVFAVTGGEVDVHAAARRAANGATRARDALSAALSWAPFIDALVVVDRAPSRVAEATVVPRRHLEDVLTAGPSQLDDADVRRIVDALTHDAPAA